MTSVVEARVAAYQDLVDLRSQKKYTVYIIAVRDNMDNEYHLEKVRPTAFQPTAAGDEGPARARGPERW